VKRSTKDLAERTATDNIDDDGEDFQSCASDDDLNDATSSAMERSSSSIQKRKEGGRGGGRPERERRGNGGPEQSTIATTPRTWLIRHQLPPRSDYGHKGQVLENLFSGEFYFCFERMHDKFFNIRSEMQTMYNENWWKSTCKVKSPILGWLK